MLAVQILSSIFSLFAKYLLVRQNVYGWGFAILGAILAACLAYAEGLNIWLMLEIYSTISYVYGYYKWKKNISNFTLQDLLLSALTLFFMLAFAYLSLGVITLVQLAMSFMFILGSGLLILKKNNSLGWVFICVGHLLLAYISIIEGLYFFCLFQILSLVVAVFGIFSKKIMI